MKIQAKHIQGDKMATAKAPKEGTSLVYLMNQKACVTRAEETIKTLAGAKVKELGRHLVDRIRSVDGFNKDSKCMATRTLNQERHSA